MPSFDIVCEADLQEIDNAVNQAKKEIATRFDFRSGKSSVDFNKTEKQIKIIADDEMKLRSIQQILEIKFAKRKLDCRVLQYQEEQTISGNLLKQEVKLRQGLEKEELKKINKLIKDTKLKVQSQIQDELIRVTAKSIDDLQAVMSALKASDLGLPLQYTNMRS